MYAGSGTPIRIIGTNGIIRIIRISRGIGVTVVNVRGSHGDGELRELAHVRAGVIHLFKLLGLLELLEIFVSLGLLGLLGLLVTFGWVLVCGASSF